MKIKYFFVFLTFLNSAKASEVVMKALEKYQSVQVYDYQKFNIDAIIHEVEYAKQTLVGLRDYLISYAETNDDQFLGFFDKTDKALLESWAFDNDYCKEYEFFPKFKLLNNVTNIDLHLVLMSYLERALLMIKNDESGQKFAVKFLKLLWPQINLYYNNNKDHNKPSAMSLKFTANNIKLFMKINNLTESMLGRHPTLLLHSNSAKDMENFVLETYGPSFTNEILFLQDESFFRLRSIMTQKEFDNEYGDSIVFLKKMKDFVGSGSHEDIGKTCKSFINTDPNLTKGKKRRAHYAEIIDNKFVAITNPFHPDEHIAKIVDELLKIYFGELLPPTISKKDERAKRKTEKRKRLRAQKKLRLQQVKDIKVEIQIPIISLEKIKQPIEKDMLDVNPDIIIKNIKDPYDYEEYDYYKWFQDYLAPYRDKECLKDENNVQTSSECDKKRMDIIQALLNSPDALNFLMAAHGYKIRGRFDGKVSYDPNMLAFVTAINGHQIDNKTKFMIPNIDKNISAKILPLNIHLPKHKQSEIILKNSFTQFITRALNKAGYTREFLDEVLGYI